MKNALLVGYYGEMNTGDDALFAVTAWGMQQFFPPTRLYAYTAHPPPLPGREVIPALGEKRFPGQNMLRMAWLTRRLNQVVFGGGSFLFAAESLTYWRRFLDRVKSTSHFAVGASFGPFKHRDDELACAEFLRRLAFVGLRDEASYARVRALCPEVRAELTFDLAPLLMLVNGENVPAARMERRGLGVALCHYERFVGGDSARERQRIVHIAEAIDRAARQDAIDELVLIDFNGHPRCGDHAIHEELRSLLGAKVPIRHLAYANNPLAVLHTIKCLRGIIAMRLHAAIFAFCTQTPCAMLAYHEKCFAWARMVELPAQQLIDAGRIDPSHLAALLAQFNAAQPALPALPLEHAIARSLRNWSWTGREDVTANANQANVGERAPS